jgi:hypothetical protein
VNSLPLSVSNPIIEKGRILLIYLIAAITSAALLLSRDILSVYSDAISVKTNVLKNAPSAYPPQ